MQHGNDSNKPNAHDENSVRGHLAPSGLIGVELKHCAGTTTTSSSSTGTAGWSTPAQACSSCRTPSCWCITIGHHLL
jgi:hypothetical protein